MFVQPGQGQGGGHILITGAIGDYGTGHKVKAGGKIYSRVVFRRGTLEVDLTAITSKSNNVNPPINTATCSASFSVTAPAPIVNGTGHYKGATGTINLTESFGFLAPRYKSGPKKGQCNLSNSAAPLAQMGAVYGTGTVSF